MFDRLPVENEDAAGHGACSWDVSLKNDTGFYGEIACM
jgi:hypothetical protein